MRSLYIGRMSILDDDDRYKNKYYNAGNNINKNPSENNWLNGLSEYDYVLMSINFKKTISNGKSRKTDSKICLWKVKSIFNDRTEFEEILDNINISLHRISSLKILKITESTTNLAMKSSSIHAFWKLELANNIVLSDSLIQEMSNKEYYLDPLNFRKIFLLENQNKINNGSFDIQMYQENLEIKLYKSPFIKDSIYNKFKDQTKYLKDTDIKLRKTKNKYLKKIVLGEIDLSIPQLYDCMFTDYLKSSGKKLLDKDTLALPHKPTRRN